MYETFLLFGGMEQCYRVQMVGCCISGLKLQIQEALFILFFFFPYYRCSTWQVGGPHMFADLDHNNLCLLCLYLPHVPIWW